MNTKDICIRDELKCPGQDLASFTLFPAGNLVVYLWELKTNAVALNSTSCKAKRTRIS